MKQLQLDLNKRLLIVEGDEKEANEFFMMDSLKAGTYRIICKGPELSEDIAKGLVESKLSGTVLGELITQIKGQKVTIYKNYKNNKWSYTALKSFISAIESKQNQLSFTIDLSKSLIFEIL